MKNKPLYCVFMLLVSLFFCIVRSPFVSAESAEEMRGRIAHLDQAIQQVERAYEESLEAESSEQIMKQTMLDLDALVEDKKLLEYKLEIESLKLATLFEIQELPANLPVKGEGASFIWPSSSKRVTSPFGMRFHPILKRVRMHEGIDIAGGGTIYAAATGQVTKLGRHPTYGNLIELSHVSGLKTRYAHLKDNSFQVKVGDVVESGQILAEMGTTGLSTGVHLHFEVLEHGKPVNPLSYLK